MATQALTLGESLAHVSRTKKWVMAVLTQIYCPAAMTLILIYYTLILGGSPSSVPWRLLLVLSYGAYWSQLLIIKSFAELFLLRTPVKLMEKLRNIGAWGVGVGVLGLMVSVVLAAKVEDDRVLTCCTCVVFVFIAGLLAFWVWLTRTYDGAALESSSTAPASPGQQPPRVQTIDVRTIHTGPSARFGRL